jgi:hypothetical protein
MPTPSAAPLPPPNNGTNHVNATTLTKSSAKMDRNVSINAHLDGTLALPSAVLLDHLKSTVNVSYVYSS